MNDIKETAKEVIKKRFSNNIYVNFGFVWLVFHWEFTYTMLFLSEDLIYQKYGILKNDYLVETFFNLNSWYFWVSWVTPIAITYLLIWWIPKYIFIPAHKKDIEYEYAKEEAELETKEFIERKKKDVVKETEARLEVESKLESEYPQYALEKDYNSFKKSKFYKDFKIIIESVYSRNGEIRIEDPYEGRLFFQIPTEILSYAHSNDLVEIEGEKIKLTSKGKYFVKEYNKDKNPI